MSSTMLTSKQWNCLRATVPCDGVLPDSGSRLVRLGFIFLTAALMGLAGCGGGGGGGGGAAAPTTGTAPPAGDTTTPVVSTYTIGGTVSGMTASSQVILQNNGTDNVTVSGNASGTASFTFATPVAANGSFSVTVATAQNGTTDSGRLICSVANNSGSGSGVVANISSVAIVCSDKPYTIGGSVSGLATGSQLTLQNNGADPRSVSTNGAFFFASAVALNSSYNVTVSAQPAGQTCTVGQGSGAGVIANVSSVSVTCAAATFGISGTVSGLANGQQVTLRNNGADPVIVSANGAFSFATPVAYDGAYSVTVGTQPTGQTCTVSQGSASLVRANVSGVSVSCASTAYTVGGLLSGLASSSQVTLRNNNSNPLTLTTNGSFVFSTPVAAGSPYAVTVGTQPSWQTCTVTQGSGTITAANVSNVGVTCVNTLAVVSTFAGTGLNGYLDANGRLASFSYPRGVAVDTSGNVFVADTDNYIIRKIAPNADVTTLPGIGTFEYPYNVALDSSGNVYVTDTYHHRIAVITPGGTVSILAGSLTPGSNNGTGTAASFNNPSGVAVDASGNVYVADTYNGLIRRITPGGVVTTFAGSGGTGLNDGAASAATFSQPIGIAVDAGGSVYVADSLNNRIRKITAGVVSTLPGIFNQPNGVAVDSSGNVYVADTFNNQISKITAAGVVSVLAGSGTAGTTDGDGALASFNLPTGITVDSSGNIYVAEPGNLLIRKITPAP